MRAKTGRRDRSLIPAGGNNGRAEPAGEYRLVRGTYICLIAREKACGRKHSPPFPSGKKQAAETPVHPGLDARAETKVLFHQVRYVETNEAWSMSDETREIDRTVEDWARIRLEALAAEAGEVAALFYEQIARERANRPRSQWGRLGVRVVRAARSAPGAFAIEWFSRRWANRTATGAQTFTSYIRRGAGDRYPRATLASVAQPWELAIADALEERFAEIRRLARSVSRMRTAFRQHAKLERTLAEKGGPDDDGVAANPSVLAGRA